MNILIPDSWLREYLETNATPNDIKNCLSLCGPSIERIIKVKDDYLYEIEITSNRVDMASILGIAGEASAILPRFGFLAKLKKGDLKKTYNLEINIKEELPIEITDPSKLCYRVLGIIMDGVKVASSPQFMKDRLEKSGIRSLNNLIDITNYVMLEVGHPCHVFDYDRIKTGKLIIRKAKKGEILITLDNKKCILSEEDVIIDDGTGRIIDLPGIMGTANSVVTADTKRILFFIESNNPVNIRKTSLRLGLRTMAATINEKHPDPELANIALLRGINLFRKLTNAKLASRIIDIYHQPTKPKAVNIKFNFINDRLGIELSCEEIIKILKSLNFQISKEKGNLLKVIPPTFRQFDVTIPEDIVEEVARIFGYHNLPSKIMTGEIPKPYSSEALTLEYKVKTMLKYWGFSEVYNYSFVSQKLLEKVGQKPYTHLKVANPLTEDTNYLRISLIPSLISNISQNQNYRETLSLFEMAKVYIPSNDNLPKEIPMLTIADTRSFFYLKGTVEQIFSELGIDNYQQSLDVKQFFHPRQVLSFVKNGEFLATLGLINPSISSNFNLHRDLFIADINFLSLVKYKNPTKKFTPLPLYPPVFEDFTFLAEEKVAIGEVINEIYKVNPLITNVLLLEQYGKNLTLRVTYQSKEKNLSKEETHKIRQSILERLFLRFRLSLKK